MSKSKDRFILLSFGIILASAGASPLLAQATFAVSSSLVTAADVGIAEVAGRVDLTVFSGTTVEAPLSVRYSALITNNSMLEIQIYGTGALAGVSAHPTLDAANNALLIDVPAGGVQGNQIRILGVRVAVAGLEEPRVTATITSLLPGGNSILVSQSVVTVIDRFLPPFSVDMSAMIPLEFKNGVAPNPQTSFLIRETYEFDFTDSVGLYGQTQPTRFRIRPFPSIPEGVSLTFATEAASTETLAILRTTSGTAETVPRADGSTDVSYQFSSAVNSPAVIESFRLFVTIDVEPTAGSGSITFQVTLEPIGAAIPDSSFPSTDIPRYWEVTLPNEEDLLAGTVELAYPFRVRGEATYTGVAVTNLLPYRTRISLAAYDANGLLISGPEITNPVSMILPRSGQYARLATEIFGPSFNALSAGTIRLTGKSSALAGFYLQGKELGAGLDGATADLNPKIRTVCPVVFREGPSPYTILEFYNPGTAPVNASLAFYDSSGRSVAQASQAIDPGGTVFADLRSLFPAVNLGSIAGGYVISQASAPIIVRQSFGNLLDFNVLQGQLPVQRSRFYLAHFASGGGYDTELNLINMDGAISASITLTLIGGDGSTLAVDGNPAQITINAGGQFDRSVAELFPSLGTALRTGYISVDVKPISSGYFTSTPPLVGSVRFSAASGYASSTLSLEMPPLTEFVYSHVVETLGYYTGIAILNSNSAQSSVTVEVYRQDGQRNGSYSTILQPAQKIAKLLHEMIPASLGQLGGYIRVKASLPVTSFSLFGSDDGLSLSAIPPQGAGN